MKFTWIIISLFSMASLYAQPSIKVEVSKDTVGVGEIVELTYTVENGQGQFSPPDLSDLPVISGPNTSSSMVYQNGRMSSSQSWSYVLRPEEAGIIHIPKAHYTDKKEQVDIDSIEIVVTKYIRPAPIQKSKPAPAPAASNREKRKF